MHDKLGKINLESRSGQLKVSVLSFQIRSRNQENGRYSGRHPTGTQIIPVKQRVWASKYCCSKINGNKKRMTFLCPDVV
jgi:hypothetical protein